jgi:uncharacterized DUF497 family protein
MKNKLTFNFSAEKNRWLIENRGVSFEEIIAVLDAKGSTDVIQHPNMEKYPHQKMIVVEFHDYIYVVPFVEEEGDVLFLKTIFPHRKFTKKYLSE